MSPRPRSTTDAEVLAGTARVIGRVGPGRFTLSEVAAEVGLAPPTLLQRFGSKRGLLLAFAEQAAAGAAREFEEARARGHSPLATLLAGLAAMTREVETPAQMANHLAVLRIDLDDPELHRHALAHARSVRAQIAALLREAVLAGELTDCDTEALARAIHSLFNGALVGWAIHREGAVEQWVRQDVETVLRPLRPDAPMAGPAG